MQVGKDAIRTIKNLLDLGPYIQTYGESAVANMSSVMKVKESILKLKNDLKIDNLRLAYGQVEDLLGWIRQRIGEWQKDKSISDQYNNWDNKVTSYARGEVIGNLNGINISAFNVKTILSNAITNNYTS